MYRVNGEELQKFAAYEVQKKSHLLPSGIGAEQLNKSIHLYCNICFTFVSHGYESGRIVTGKTRRGVRDYLAQKENRIVYNGIRFANCVKVLEAIGLIKIDNKKLVAIVPEDLVKAGEYSAVNKAVRVISRYGLFNLTAELLEQYELTRDDIVSATCQIESLLPKPATKKQIRELVDDCLQKAELANQA